MPEEFEIVKPGDVLVRWVGLQAWAQSAVNPTPPDDKAALKGGMIHKQIGKLQEAARKHMTREEVDSIITKYADKHIVHVGIVGGFPNRRIVYEVSGKNGGVKIIPIEDRQEYDFVIRFDDQKAVNEIVALLEKIPEISFKYPMTYVGVGLWANLKSKLVKNPAQSQNKEFYEQLDKQLDQKKYKLDQKKYISWPLSEDEKQEKYLFEIFADAVEQKEAMSLYDINDMMYGVNKLFGKKIEGKFGCLPNKRIQSFTCSHFVNAVLHKAFYPNLSLVTLLRDDIQKYKLSPSEVFRECCYKQGVWKKYSKTMKGIEHKGNIYKELSNRFLQEIYRTEPKIKSDPTHR